MGTVEKQRMPPPASPGAKGSRDALAQVCAPGSAWGLLCVSLVLLALCGCFVNSEGVYKDWYKHSKAEYDDFRKLAKHRRWNMYVLADRKSIGILDLATSAYKPLYSAPHGRVIWTASRFYRGRIAFIECAEKGGWLSSYNWLDFELGILDKDGAVKKVSLGPTFDQCGAVAVSPGERYILFARGYETAYLYDTEANTLHRVYDQAHADMQDTELVEGKFLVLLIGDPLKPRSMLVLDSREPYEEVSRREGVSRIAAVGKHIVIEKEKVCVLYDPASGNGMRLTRGELLGPWGEDEFLLYRADVLYTKEEMPRRRYPDYLRPIPYVTEKAGSEIGVPYRDYRLYRYSISTRRKHLVWRRPAVDRGFRMRPPWKKPYEIQGAFLSPQKRFLFIPWHVPPGSHAEMHVAPSTEYEVYDLRSGKKCGAFLNPYEGKLHIRFLGWAGGD